MNYYLAIDLGATSGRHVVGYLENGEIVLKEVHRFKTEMDGSPDGLVWNIPRIYGEIKLGIKKAFELFPTLTSISIDTWGVDYVLMNGDQEIPPYFAYRNERCFAGAKKAHSILSFKEIYARTGIQYQAFDTLYQLVDDLKRKWLKEATDYLMMPSYFTYKLTGIKTHEYTNESTGALLNPYTGEYDYELLDRLGLPRKLFGEIKKPGYEVGELLPEIQKEVGGNAKVVLCASHDTASAFEAIDVDGESIILSSGTWSLMGIKSKEPVICEKGRIMNFTNEGGVGYIRLLRNLMGMYIANRLKDEVGLDYKTIDEKIRQSKYTEAFSVLDSRLNAPKSMKETLLELLKYDPPKNDIDMFAAVFRSQAISYWSSADYLKEITGKQFKKLYVVGGGAKNEYLNRLIEEYTHLQIIPLPIEATALGNIKTQMKARKES